MGRQPSQPPYYSTLVEDHKQFSTNIPKPVAKKMKEKSNSNWKVTFKFEKNKKSQDIIKLYWEPLKLSESSDNL